MVFVEHEFVGFIQKLVDEQHLIQRAMESYKLTIKNDLACLPPHIRPEDVQAEFRTQSLYFKNSLLSSPYIDTTVDLVAHGERIGYYRLITMLDGTTDDDYFVIEI
jgi:hypothetical protein